VEKGHKLSKKSLGPRTETGRFFGKIGKGRKFFFVQKRQKNVKKSAKKDGFCEKCTRFCEKRYGFVDVLREKISGMPFAYEGVYLIDTRCWILDTRCS